MNPIQLLSQLGGHLKNFERNYSPMGVLGPKIQELDRQYSARNPNNPIRLFFNPQLRQSPTPSPMIRGGGSGPGMQGGGGPGTEVPNSGGGPVMPPRVVPPLITPPFTMPTRQQGLLSAGSRSPIEEFMMLIDGIRSRYARR